MRLFLKYFIRGLIVIAPVAVTVYVCWIVFERVDSWLGLPIPGAGFVLTVLIITLVGALASNLVTRGLVSSLEGAMERLPFVRLLYTSTRDLLNAFVGEKRRFDRPVVVTLTPDGSVKMLGFVTTDALDRLGLPGHVAVYLPQSYAFAGNLLVVPLDRIRALPAESAETMAFIVSGGVTSEEVRGIGNQPLPVTPPLGIGNQPLPVTPPLGIGNQPLPVSPPLGIGNRE
ncbi:MAG TPA: DUF502 domain-containing protein [Gemmatimonadaceae bacterium]|nr:DUF502 domain-containing protein [Gemmatimonadaceae bacterium]